MMLLLLWIGTRHLTKYSWVCVTVASSFYMTLNYPRKVYWNVSQDKRKGDLSKVDPFTTLKYLIQSYMKIRKYKRCKQMRDLDRRSSRLCLCLLCHLKLMILKKSERRSYLTAREPWGQKNPFRVQVKAGEFLNLELQPNTWCRVWLRTNRETKIPEKRLCDFGM